TAAPSLRRRWATARPMPRVPPVTIATFPEMVSIKRWMRKTNQRCVRNDRMATEHARDRASLHPAEGAGRTVLTACRRAGDIVRAGTGHPRGRAPRNGARRAGRGFEPGRPPAAPGRRLLADGRRAGGFLP